MAILSDEFYYQPIRIDTINTRVYADLLAKEGDANGRGLLVTLTENGLMKDTTGITLILKWEHTSVGNQGLDNFEAVDPSKGLYKITYPTEMLNRGKVRAFIRIIDSGKLAGTRNIGITVDRGVGDDTAIASSDSFSALASALIEVQSWNARIDDVEQDFIDRANNLDTIYPIELNSVKQQLADIDKKKVVNVEDFNGANVLEKIQNAVNYALLHQKSVEFSKLYDITGLGSINIVKPYDASFMGDTGTFYIIGKSGGIRKDDDGYIFENPVEVTSQQSDFNISGMLFESRDKATATNVWNVDYFFRINSHDNTYLGIDSGFRSDSKLGQSIRIQRESVRGGNGYFVFLNTMIDVTISDNLIESRHSGYGYSGGGIANSVPTSQVPGAVSNFNIRIENNVIEGLGLAGVKLGNCVASIISGNYMEANGAYYDLVTLNDGTYYNSALSFFGNHTQLTPQQVTDGVPTLKIKSIHGVNTSGVKQKGNCFFSNNRSLGILYEVTDNSFISSAGDYATGLLCNPVKQLILVGGANPLPINVGNGSLATIVSGLAYGYRKTTNIGLNATERKIVAITVTNAYFAKPISTNSVISVTATDLTNIKIHGFNWVHASSNIATVNVDLENVSAGFLSAEIKINVINLGDEA